MDGVEPTRSELLDFNIGRSALIDAVEKGQAESAKDLLENGVKDLRLLTMHLFRIAFRNNDMEMIRVLVPFGKEKELQVKIGILEDAVKTKNSEIVNIVYSELEVSNERLKLSVLRQIQELLPPGSTGSIAEEISAAPSPRVIIEGSTKESFTVALEQIDEIDAALVEAVMAAGDDEYISILADVISRGGFTAEHKAIFPWLIKNWPDPDLIDHLKEIADPKASAE